MDDVEHIPNLLLQILFSEWVILRKHIGETSAERRRLGPRQGTIGANAPIRLIYVVDIDKFKSAGFPEPGLYDPEIQKSYYFVDTGLIAQNVYVAASSIGLVSWFHNCNKTELAKVLGLKPLQRALFGHTIGYAGD